VLKVLLIIYAIGYILNFLFVVYCVVYDPRNPSIDLKLKFLGTGIIESFLWPRFLLSLFGLL